MCWLKNLPSKSGISSTLVPKALVTGHTPDYHKHCKVGFGTYVQTHEAQTTQWRHRQFEISLSAPLVTHMVGITSVLLALLSEYIVLSGQNPQCECKNLLRTEMVSQFWESMMK